MKYVLLSMPIYVDLEMSFLHVVVLKGLKATNPQFDFMWICSVVYSVWFSKRISPQADNQVDHVRQHFYEVSLEYVFKVQEVQERKMFEFVEPVKPHHIL